MTITALPLFPVAGDPNFEAKVDALGLALQVFVPEVNATAAAMTLNGTNDTSATSNSLTTGNKTFTVSPGKSFQKSQYLVIGSTAAPTTQSMIAQVSDYNSGTGVLSVNVISVTGTGTLAAWSISMTAYVPVSAAMSPVMGATTVSEARSLLGIGVAKRKNQVVNGNFLVDVRNKGVAKTIVAAASPVFTVDRWYASCTGANATVQQVTAGIEKRLNLVGSTGCTGIKLGTRLIAENSGNFNGSNCTLSIGVSGPSFTLNWEAYAPSGAGSNGFGTLAAPTRTLVASGSLNIVRDSDTEKRYFANLSLGFKSINGVTLQPIHLWGAINIEFTATGAAVSNSSIFLGDVQLESGNLPTAFEDVGLREARAECELYAREVVTSLRFTATAGSQVSDTTLNWAKMFKAPTASTVSTGATANATGGILVDITDDSARVSISSAAAGDSYLTSRRFLLEAEV